MSVPRLVSLCLDYEISMVIPMDEEFITIFLGWYALKSLNVDLLLEYYGLTDL